MSRPATSPTPCELCEQAKADGKGWSVGLTGNAATVLPQLLELGFKAEIVTDQTSAHDLMDYIPEGEIDEVLALRAANPEEFKQPGPGVHREARARPFWKCSGAAPLPWTTATTCAARPKKAA